VKILIADDSLVYRRALNGFLKKWGHEVVQATDGDEALEILLGPENSPKPPTKRPARAANPSVPGHPRVDRIKT
jgi:CheY-like chemotaxis protein